MYLLGIDLGTTGCKSVIFSSGGEIVSQSYIEYSLIKTPEGFIEQDADLWWELVKKSVKEAVDKSDISSKSISALSVSSQGIAFVPVDKDGKTLYNAISWLDMRAYRQAEFIRSQFGERAVFERTGKRVSPVYSLPKIMWLKDELPQVYNRTWKILMGLDYITFKFTGIAVTDHSMASGTMAYNITEKCWDADILEKCGIDGNMLPELAFVGQRVGRILPEVAQETGLSPDTTVVLGAQDQKCAAIGAGIKKGVCTVSLGTASAISTITEEPSLDSGMSIPCFTLDNKSWIHEAVIGTAGVSLKWMKNSLFADKSYTEINKMVESVSPGAGGLFFYPHLEGATSPYWKPEAKGCIYGLNISTSPGEILRAMYEGIAYQIRVNIEVMECFGTKIEEIRVFGGGSKSDVWCSIIAGITGKPVSVLYTSETANLGAAVAAGIGSGIYENYDSVISRIKLVEKTFIPDNSNVRIYSEFYPKYCRMQKRILLSDDEFQ